LITFKDRNIIANAVCHMKLSKVEKFCVGSSGCCSEQS